MTEKTEGTIPLWLQASSMRNTNIPLDEGCKIVHMASARHLEGSFLLTKGDDVLVDSSGQPGG